MNKRGDGSRRATPLNPATQRRLASLAERHRLTPASVATRVVKWLEGQPEFIQAAVLGRYSKRIDLELAKQIILAMVSGN